jgi:Nucleotidyltransferase domain
VTRSDELRAVAERVAALLPETVSDVVLTGSTARGVADGLSDIELLVIADQLPDRLPLENLDTWSPNDSAHWFGGLFEREFVELIWWTRAYVEERVRAIAAGEVVDHARLRTAEAILNGLPLRGDGHARWAAQLAVYPDGLAEKIVADAAATFRDTESQMRSVQRPGDALVLAQRVAEYAEGVLRIVFARNREWEPGWKRLPLRLESLALKPDRLAERVDAAVRALDLSTLAALAEEALA